MNARTLTKQLAYPVKQILKRGYAAVPLPVRYGRVFRDTYKFLQESQWWSIERLQEYQMGELRRLFTHCRKHVPYYRQLFTEQGLDLEEPMSLDILRQQPYLTKEVVKERLPDLIAENCPKSRLELLHTGGTTGIPLLFFEEKPATRLKESAFVWRAWNWAGLRCGERRVILRGRMSNRFKNGRRLSWEYEPREAALILSSFDMTEDVMQSYVKRIRDFKPAAIQAYPSSLCVLADYLRRSNLSLGNLKCILTSSETLYAEQRRMIEETLGARIFDLYGNSEKSGLATQCEHGRYHIIPEYGIVELVGENENPVCRHGEVGEIVTTGFINRAVPVIRYRTGDLAVYSTDKCPCGRNHVLLQRIQGRVQEYFVDKTGALITFTYANTALRDFEDKVILYQFVQEEPGRIHLKIVEEKRCSASDIELMKKHFMRVYSRLELTVERVPEIPRTKSGKFRYFVQKLPVAFGGHQDA